MPRLDAISRARDGDESRAGFAMCAEAKAEVEAEVVDSALVDRPSPVGADAVASDFFVVCDSGDLVGSLLGSW